MGIGSCVGEFEHGTRGLGPASMDLGMGTGGPGLASIDPSSIGKDLVLNTEIWESTSGFLCPSVEFWI